MHCKIPPVNADGEMMAVYELQTCCIHTLWGENADVPAVKEVVNIVTIVPLLLINVYT
jgi:hypothetical protein